MPAGRAGGQHAEGDRMTWLFRVGPRASCSLEEWAAVTVALRLFLEGLVGEGTHIDARCAV